MVHILLIVGGRKLLLQGRTKQLTVTSLRILFARKTSGMGLILFIHE